MTDAVPNNFRLPYLALTLEQREIGFELLKAVATKDLVGDSLSVLEDGDFNYCI
jgi:4-hydroxy-tetrahydrodipicolinate synthase